MNNKNLIKLIMNQCEISKYGNSSKFVYESDLICPFCKEQGFDTIGPSFEDYMKTDEYIKSLES